jgi:hypothetical protein
MKKNINVLLSFSIIVACRVVLKTKWQAGQKYFWEDILLILSGLSGRETWVHKRKNMLNSDFLGRIMCLYQETIISTFSNIVTCLHNLFELGFYKVTIQRKNIVFLEVSGARTNISDLRTNWKSLQILEGGAVPTWISVCAPSQFFQPSNQACLTS